MTIKVGETDVYAWKEPSPNSPATYRLLRGSATRPDELVEPAVPVVLDIQKFRSVEGRKIQEGSVLG